MGLRCLLGHDFGEPETERERTEEGNEVVVTVREVKTCERCGEKQVVSENKEIKSIEQLREAGRAEPPEETGGAEFDGEPTPEVEPRGEPETGVTGGPEESASEAEPEAKEPAVGELIEDAEAGEPISETSPGAEAGAEETVSGVGDETPVHPAQRGEGEEAGEETDADDAVILDEDAPVEERGQWSDEAEPDEVTAAGPDAETPATAEAESDDEDAVIMGGEESSGEAGAEAEAASEAETLDDELSEPTTPEDEDEGGIIMGDEGAETEPDSEPASEHAPWPEQRGEDEGHNAESPDGQAADVDFSGGLAPDSGEAASNGAQTQESGAQAAARGEPRDGQSSDEAEANAGETQTESASQSGDRSGDRSRPTSTLDLEESEREANLEYYCPECGLTRSVGNSSMRAGDICPECRRGYIEERERTSAN